MASQSRTPPLLTLPEHVKAVIKNMDPDPDREGLRDTPARYCGAMQEMTSGYYVDVDSLLKTFSDGARGYNEMVFVGAIPFYSTCVVGSTFVETPRGRIPIQYLKSGDWVYSVDGDTYEISLRQCVNPRRTRKNAKLVRVYTDHDTVLCTPDHKFLTFNRGWQEAQNLLPEDRVVSMYRTSLKQGYVGLAGRKHDRRNDGPAITTVVGKFPIAEHRFVFQQKTGQWFQRKPIHHIDDARWNNDPTNLEDLTIADHNRRHGKLSRHNTRGTAEFDKRRSAAAVANGTPEKRRKQSENAFRQHRASQNHVVLGVEKITWREDVWCMDVPGTNTFFANGMAVHNCEHHLAPFFGTAHVAYIPNKSGIVGLSKIPRLVDAFAKRLTVQERITTQVADTLDRVLQPMGAAVMLQARHMCMEMRGVKTPGTITTTTALRGVFMKHDARAEFYAMVSNATITGIR